LVLKTGEMGDGSERRFFGQKTQERRYAWVESEVGKP
jgi:hypothetical protein